MLNITLVSAAAAADVTMWAWTWTSVCLCTSRRPRKHQRSSSLRFNSHFPGEPGLAVVYWSKGWWRWRWQLEL